MGCPGAAVKRGWCDMHWSRWYRNGDPLKRARPRLTAGQVRAIRAACAAGESQRAVAIRYGLTEAAVSHIVLRRRWKHV